MHHRPREHCTGLFDAMQNGKALQIRISSRVILVIVVRRWLAGWPASVLASMDMGKDACSVVQSLASKRHLLIRYCLERSNGGRPSYQPPGSSPAAPPPSGGGEEDKNPRRAVMKIAIRSTLSTHPSIHRILCSFNQRALLLLPKLEQGPRYSTQSSLHHKTYLHFVR